LVGAVPTNPTNADLTASQQSAKAILDGALIPFGLQSLSNTVWQWYLQGRPIEQIMLDLRTTPEYQQRFPAMDALAKKGRAISEQQYIDYERGAAQLFQSAGLPANFYDQPDDFANFLTNDIALPELQQRIGLYQTAAYQAPKEVRDELQSRYGVTDGELTAFFIDPNRALPLIQQKFGAAQAAGHSNLSGFGALTQAEAERVGRQGLTEQQLAQGFGELGHLAPLFEALPGSGEFDLSKTTGIAAQFDSDAQAQRELQRRAAARKASFGEGGQFGSSQQGFTGTGSA
jgi:hypothetical protein